MLSILLFIASVAYSSPVFKFTLSWGACTQGGKCIEYKAKKDTWLAPLVYMQQTKLPSFQDYLDSRPNLKSSLLDAAPIGEATMTKLEYLRDEALAIYINNTYKPTPAQVARVDEILLEADQIFNGSLGVEFVLPIIQFWASSHNINADTPICSRDLHWLDGKGVYHCSKLDDISSVIDMYVNPPNTVRNPFGFGEEYRCVIDGELSEMVMSALQLNIYKMSDEKMDDLYTMEEKMWNRTSFFDKEKFKTTVKLILVIGTPGHQFVAEAFNIKFNDTEWDDRYGLIRLYTDMKAHIHGSVKYVCKSDKFTNDTYEIPALLGFLPKDGLEIIKCALSHQFYFNPLRLVCKAFYRHFHDIPCKARPITTSHSSRNTFYCAVFLAKLRRGENVGVRYVKRTGTMGRIYVDKNCLCGLARPSCPDFLDWEECSEDWCEIIRRLQ